MNETVTLQEVVAMTGLTEQTVYSYIGKKQIPKPIYRENINNTQWDKDTIVRWVKARHRKYKDTRSTVGRTPKLEKIGSGTPEPIIECKVGNEEAPEQATTEQDNTQNNGGDTDYYRVKSEWSMVQDIIEDRKMNYAQGNILKVAFTFNTGRHEGTDYVRELNKIIWFANRELSRIKKEE